MAKSDDEHIPSGAGGLLRGLRDLLDLVADLPLDEQGGAAAEKTWESAHGKIRAVHGWTVRVGAPSRIEPFGNLRHGRQGPTIAETREPLVDVFHSPDEVTIVCELPGVAEEQIELTVEERSIRLKAKSEDHDYEKTITLPCAVAPGALKRSFRHGLLELRLARRRDDCSGGNGHDGS